MIILSHRGIIEEEKNFPNSLSQLMKARDMGFSLEIDLRFSLDKKVVISHDADLKETLGLDKNISDVSYSSLESENELARNTVPELRTLLYSLNSSTPYNGVLALHIKDSGDKGLVRAALGLIQEFSFDRKSFLFDLELGDLRDIKKEFPAMKLGVSVGEANYAPAIYKSEEIEPFLNHIDVIWADEWKDGLYTRDFFSYYKELGKEIYAVSPELHKREGHPFSGEPHVVWEKIKPFEFGGICTDFPKAADAFFNSQNNT